MIQMVDQKSDTVDEENKMKSCVDCGATKTPLWRSGPAGPKSLCNACGIKSRKRRELVSGVPKSSSEVKKAKRLTTNSQSSTSSSCSSNKESNKNRNDSSTSSKLNQPLEKKLVPLGQEVKFQRSIAERLRRRLGEEEQAAMLLMSLSYGSVY